MKNFYLKSIIFFPPKRDYNRSNRNYKVPNTDNSPSYQSDTDYSSTSFTDANHSSTTTTTTFTTTNTLSVYSTTEMELVRVYLLVFHSEQQPAV